MLQRARRLAVGAVAGVPPVGLACLTVAADADGASASSSAAASAGQIPLPIRRCGSEFGVAGVAEDQKPRIRSTFVLRKRGFRVVARRRRAGARAGRSRAGRERLAPVAAGAGARGRGRGPARGRPAAHDRDGGVRRAAAHVADGAPRPDRRRALPRLRRARPRRHVVPRRHRGPRQHGARGPGHARRALSAAGARVERLLAPHEPVHPAGPGLRAARLGGGHRAMPDEPVRADSRDHRQPPLARQAGALPAVRAAACGPRRARRCGSSTCCSRTCRGSTTRPAAPTAASPRSRFRD